MKFITPVVETEKYESADIMVASLNPTDPTQPTTIDKKDPYESDKF